MGNENIKLQDLTFDRKTVTLKGDKKKEFPLTEQGFLWDKGDAETGKFRPQGITTVTKDCRELVITSWYGKSKKNYENRGARISVIDVTLLKNEPEENNYRHILLVDKDKNTFYDEGYEEEKGTLHAGGIAYVDGKLHVADSRSAHRVIRVFDLDKIQITNPKILKYSHILMEEYNYRIPIKPSFLSYDKDRGELLTGEFHEKPSDKAGVQNLIAWWKAPQNPKEAAAFNKKLINVYRLPNKYKKIQGMTSMKDPNDATKQILWISTSYAPSKRSNLYKLQIDGAEKFPSEYKAEMIEPIDASKGKNYPPGLEDAHISDNKQLWLLTEFYFKEGEYYPLDSKQGGDIKGLFSLKKTRRGVFAIDCNSEI